MTKDEFDLFLDDVRKQITIGKSNHLAILRMIDLEYRHASISKPQVSKETALKKARDDFKHELKARMIELVEKHFN